MSIHTISLSNPETAVPLLANPDYQQSLVVVAHDIVVTGVQALGSLEYAMADRFDCDYTQYELPRLGFIFGSTLETLDREYRKACTTQPKNLFMHFDLSEKDKVLAAYVMPLAAIGKERKAVAATHSYEARDIKTKAGQRLRKLAKQTIHKARVESNPFYEPTVIDENSQPNRIRSGSILGAARRAGRAGATRY